MLVVLAEKMGQDELAARFREALVDEEDHLERVRLWLQSSLEGQAGVADKGSGAPPPAAPTPPL
jgi:rubrerythrin